MKRLILTCWDAAVVTFWMCIFCALFAALWVCGLFSSVGHEIEWLTEEYDL